MNMYHKIQVVVDFEIDTRTYSAAYALKLVRSAMQAAVDDLFEDQLKDFSSGTLSAEVVSSIDREAK